MAVATPAILSSRSAVTAGHDMSEAQIAPRPYASNEIRVHPVNEDLIGQDAPGASSNPTSRPKKAVRFQVYNAKDMETLRSMRH